MTWNDWREKAEQELPVNKQVLHSGPLKQDTHHKNFPLEAFTEILECSQTIWNLYKVWADIVDRRFFSVA
jgi:hypothetical protein